MAPEGDLIIGFAGPVVGIAAFASLCVATVWNASIVFRRRSRAEVLLLAFVWGVVGALWAAVAWIESVAPMP
jgi:hypothetical protein